MVMQIQYLNICPTQFRDCFVPRNDDFCEFASLASVCLACLDV